MMIVCVLLASCFTALMFYKMVLPLLAPVTPSSLELLDDDLKELEELVNLKALLMSNINELELDRELEKITKEDYTQLKRRAQRQIISIMKQLDGIHGGRGWEEKIEQELLRRRTPQTESRIDADSDEAPEDTLKSDPAETPARIVATSEAKPLEGHQECPACGNNVRIGAKFCDECGHSMPSHSLVHSPQAQELAQ